MAAKRNIPFSDISANQALREAYEEAVKKDPIKTSDFRKAAQAMDPSSMKSLKDLSSAVKDQKAAFGAIEKAMKNIDTGIGTLQKSTTQLLTDSIDIQKKLLLEVQKLQKLTKREDDELVEKLDKIDRDIKHNEGLGVGGRGEKADALSFKQQALKELATLGRMGLFAGAGYGGLKIGTGINEKIKEFTKSDIGQNIGEIFSAGKKKIGWTQENLPGLTEAIRSWYGTGIPAMLGGKTKEEFEESHHLAKSQNEISQDIRRAQLQKDIGSFRYGGVELTEEQRKRGQVNPWDRRDQPAPQTDLTTSTGSTGPGGPATGTFKDKAPSIMARLQKDFGISKEQAAGVVGSLAAETGGFRLMQEQNPRSGRGGYGWAQWTGPRRREFESFAKEKGLDITSDEANYQFLAHELRTSQSGELERLRQAKTASEASRLFTGSTREGFGFLRPGAEHYGASQRFAEQAMGIETPKASETTGATTPSDTKNKQDASPTQKAFVGKSLDGVNSSLSTAFGKAAAEYFQKTGRYINVTSGLRSRAEQERLWANRFSNPNPVAPPGTSKHERGLAIDVNTKQAQELDSMGLLSKYGLARPVRGDPVHIEMAGGGGEPTSTPTSKAGATTPGSAGAPAPTVGATPSPSPSIQAPIGPRSPMTPGMGMGGMMPGMGGMGMLGGMMGMIPGAGRFSGLLNMAMPLLGGLFGNMFGMGEAEAAEVQAPPVVANVPVPPVRPSQNELDNINKPIPKPTIRPKHLEPAPMADVPVGKHIPGSAPVLNQGFQQTRHTPKVVAENLGIGTGGPDRSPASAPDWARSIKDLLIGSSYA